MVQIVINQTVLPDSIYVDSKKYVPEGEAPPTPIPPNPNPIPPNPTPGSCSGPNDLSDRGDHINVFAEGIYQRFCFRSPSGGYVELSVVSVANSNAKTGHWSVDDGLQQSFTPSGNFKFQPINGWVSPGTHIVDIAISGIQGEGRFMTQAVGSGVGP